MDKTKKFPDNLLDDIFDGKALKQCDLADDVLISIEYILLLLKAKSDQMHQVVKYRYKYGKTYQEIGELMGISNERVRQIKVAALRYIRNPKRSDILKNGLVQTVSAQMQQEHDFGYREGYAQGFSHGVKEGAQKEPGHSSCSRDAMRLDALGLSTRSRNALHRAGLKTAGEIAALSYYDLANIANLGTKCVQEIASAMATLGYDVAAMQPPTHTTYSTKH